MIGTPNFNFNLLEGSSEIFKNLKNSDKYIWGHSILLFSVESTKFILGYKQIFSENIFMMVFKMMLLETLQLKQKYHVIKWIG